MGLQRAHRVAHAAQRDLGPAAELARDRNGELCQVGVFRARQDSRARAVRDHSRGGSDRRGIACGEHQRGDLTAACETESDVEAVGAGRRRRVAAQEDDCVLADALDVGEILDQCDSLDRRVQAGTRDVGQQGVERRGVDELPE